MKKIGRILSLIVCFQLTWGCQPNAPVSDSSSGPAEGYTQLSGSVTLAFLKVTELLVPSAAAQSSFTALDMASNIPGDCSVDISAVPASVEESKKVAHLIDYSDLTKPCRIKEIELKVSADGETAEYNVEIESSLVEDKVVALVYGDDENQVYKNAIFSIDKGDRIIGQHLNDESSVKAEILASQLISNFSGVEFSDDVKSDMRDRVKALKQIEDFGFDLLGDKDKMIALLKNPDLKGDLINALIQARDAKENEGESDASSISDAYSSVIAAGTNAASQGGLELKDFLRMQCSPDHVFVAKYGSKGYVLQFASTDSESLQSIASQIGREVKNGRFSFEPFTEVGEFNGYIGKIFWIVRDEMQKLKTKISFKIIISDPEKKESDRSCILTIAPPGFDFEALEKFNFKAYGSFDEAMRGLEVLQKNLFGEFSNKLMLNDGQITEEESVFYNSQEEKAGAIVTSLREKINKYFKSFYASKGLGIDLGKFSAFKYKDFKSPSEARQALSDLWSLVYSNFKEKLSKKLEAKELTEEEFNKVFNFQVHLGKEQHSKIYQAINGYFHGIYASKEFVIDLKRYEAFDFKGFANREDAIKALEELNSINRDEYKQMMTHRLEASEISQEDFDLIFGFEMEVADNKYWEIYNVVNEYFNSL